MPDVREIARRELFVYWHVAADQAGAALTASRAFQAAQASRHLGLRCALYQRHDTAGLRTTVLETYAMPTAAAGIDAGLEVALVAAGIDALGAWCPGGRHLEAFDTFSTTSA